MRRVEDLLKNKSRISYQNTQWSIWLEVSNLGNQVVFSLLQKL